ncbi:MAG: KilA-N domain-containing protein, partial [Planctomycetales bacterium]|nr:KilA-N domain-containing protein [Planctomycetales bacterium]
MRLAVDAEPDSDQYVNGTQMAKANGKLIGDYLRNDQTQAFLAALSSDMGIP